MKRIDFKLTISLSLSIILCEFISAQPSESVINKIQSAIVRVESGKMIGTGFLWKNSNWVVTNLHLIKDKNSINVTMENEVQDATVIKVLKEYDLVLLELESNTSDLTVISEINASPNLNMSLYTMGYNGTGNLNSIIDRTLRLGFNRSGTLEGLLNDTLLQVFKNCRRPSPYIEILYLQGSLLPGFSGSPLIDNYGKLVGISDGGLEKGSKSISWGIKAIKLNDLLLSNESFPTYNSCGIGKEVMFSSENLLEDSEIDYIEFGDYKFLKTRTRSIEQMMTTIDDPAGLLFLVNFFSMQNKIDYLQFKYDIYEDINTGLTLCVPEGSKLTVEDDYILAAYPESDIAYISWPSEVFDSNPNPIYRYTPVSKKFQEKIIERDGGKLTYQFDGTLSYTSPIFKTDGLTVNRIAYYGYSADTDQFNQIYYNQKTYSFQTHVAKGNLYMGVAALDENYTKQVADNMKYCLNSGQCLNRNSDLVCSEFCDKYILYVKLVIGVHMSGISNN